jgi:CubicO group peptidase (beta-lactamase class C family)
VERGDDPMFNHAHRLNHSELIQATLNNPRWRLETEPGEEWEYSNFGYCLLGRIIEKITGKSYIEYVRQEFNVDCHLAGNTFSELKKNENTYYSV